MSVTVVREAAGLRIVSFQGDFPLGQPIQLLSREEWESLTAAQAWAQVPEPTRNAMMLQAQANSYQEWMEESPWDGEELDRLQKSPVALPLADFHP